MNHIVCFHLFNDYSGSPKVLKGVLEGLLEKGYPVDLVTSGGGVLDELIGKPGFRKHGYRYRFSTNPIVTSLLQQMCMLSWWPCDGSSRRMWCFTSIRCCLWDPH